MFLNHPNTNLFISVLFLSFGIFILSHGDQEKSSFDVELSGKYVGKLNLYVLLFLSCIITSISHIAYLYGKNEVRMYEYSLSASFMFVVIARLTLIKEIYTLVCLFTLMTCTMFFGKLEEIARNGNTFEYMAQAHVMGFAPFLVAWSIVLYQFFFEVDVENIPTFVYVIVFSQFFLFLAFGFVQYYYAVRYKMRNDVVENMNGAYNLLSITSKVLLIWTTFGGIR